ncbi:hypothetical protein [Citricoccus sp. SGAir0253]|uniref:hypothetical protein n=1 Tax=Citricoccus sp. SGAir0253 TaxID=2567881 RepID=UPI001108EB4A|nr:hypothetical protein [Citricoccus sp. SGAir0253]
MHITTARTDADGDGTPDCEWLDVGCGFGNAATEATNNAVDGLAASVLEGLVDTVTDLGTMWVRVPTVNVTDELPEGADPSLMAESPDLASDVPVAVPVEVAGEVQIDAVLGYVQWGGFAVAILGLLFLGATMALEGRRGQGGIASLGRMGLVLGGTILIAAAAAMTAALMGDGPEGDGSRAVNFLHAHLWWYIAALVGASIIIGAVKMIWEQRAQPGQDLVKSLLKFIVVSGSGITVAGLLITASDEFSVWILSRSLDCSVATNAACFEDGVKLILGLTGQSYWSGLGALLIIVIGVVAVLIGLFQIMLMVARSALLVLGVGLLPVMAAATNTQMGQAWFSKGLSWLIAFILYKPTAAIIYAVGFQLVGSMLDAQNNRIDLFSVITGVMLLLLSIVALPLLMRFTAPMVSAASSGGGGGSGAAMAAAAALPTGAAMLGRGMGGRGSGSAGSMAPSGAGTTGSRSSGAGGSSGVSPASPGGGPRGGGSSGPRPAPVPAGVGAGATGTAHQSGAAGPAATAGAPGTAASAAPAGGAASNGAASGGAAASSGAAGGPAGMAIAGAVAQGAQKAKEAVETVANDAVGEGPSGSSK